MNFEAQILLITKDLARTSAKSLFPRNTDKTYTAQLRFLILPNHIESGSNAGATDSVRVDPVIRMLHH